MSTFAPDGCGLSGVGAFGTVNLREAFVLKIRRQTLRREAQGHPPLVRVWQIAVAGAGVNVQPWSIQVSRLYKASFINVV